MTLFYGFWTDSVVVVGAVLLIIYISCLRRYQYWKNRGIVNVEPTFPFGHMTRAIFQKEQFGEIFANIYNLTKHHKYSGVFMIHRPTFVINDLELIKTILVKDFVHFSDHGFHYDEETEPISSHLFNASGEKWKNLRIKLTPTFTSSKMKQMFEIVANCSSEMLTYLNHNINHSENVNLKELMAKLNTDVIGNCAFGLTCNSFINPNSEFIRMGKMVFEPNMKENIVNMLDFFFPNIFSKLKAKVNGSVVQNFFYKIVDDTIKYREDNGIVRNDFMQLLIQLKHSGRIDDEADTSKSGKPEDHHDDGTRLTTMQIAAQVFVFFIAGFETSSTTASFALYELALNPDIQDTLRKEIDEVLEKHEGKVTYEALGEMTYLTKCIEETLRKYPPLPIIFRICTKEYTIPGTDIKIEKETPVMIPILGIQRDPQYFPDPMKFDPERFSPENKAARHHFSYLPFGEGPRLCIGSRFGMMQTRLGLVSVLSKYEVSVCEKTLIPMVYNKRSFIMAAEGGLWLNLTKRNK